MDKTTMIRTGIAATVAGLGLSVGGVALASADDESGKDGSSQAGPGMRHRMGGELASELADKLGLDEAKVQDALEKVHESLHEERPQLEEGERPEPPTEAEIAKRQAALAKALAKELGITEAKVTKALTELRAQAEERRDEFRADARDDLVERLDAAVKAGTLTEADKTSVLKAYDADLIGGGPMMMHRGGGGR